LPGPVDRAGARGEMRDEIFTRRPLFLSIRCWPRRR
jgi:hypothetical protein